MLKNNNEETPPIGDSANTSNLLIAMLIIVLQAACPLLCLQNPNVKDATTSSNECDAVGSSHHLLFYITS